MTNFEKTLIGLEHIQDCVLELRGLAVDYLLPAEVLDGIDAIGELATALLVLNRPQLDSVTAARAKLAIVRMKDAAAQANEEVA